MTTFAPDLPLSLGALVGILLSGGFVWWEVGRYATPQVPASLFDERRELFAYTAGLFVGVPLAIVFVLFVDAMESAVLFGGLIFLAVLVVATEAAQTLILRTRYWGRGESTPFYALGYRASIGGIMVLALVSQYFASSLTITWDGIALVLVQSTAVVVLEVAGALLSIRPVPGAARPRGGPVSGGVFGAIGFFLLGLGALSGETGAFLGAALALLGAYFVYQRLRPLLATIPSPEAAPPLAREEPATAFGRLPGSEPKK
jgi:hypothetical protein